MHRINKVDYFMGVFIATILKSSKGTPTIFNASDNSKLVEFTNDFGDYNVYIKYSTSLKEVKKTIDGEMKDKASCNILFFDNEYDFLKNNFYNSEKENLICLICTNDDLTKTYMVVIKYEDAMKCLVNRTSSGWRRISINRIATEPYFACYGVGFKEYEHIKVPVDFTKSLGLEADAELYHQLSMI